VQIRADLYAAHSSWTDVPALVCPAFFVTQEMSRIEAQFVVAEMLDVRVNESVPVVVEQAVVTSGHSMYKVASIVLRELGITTVDVTLTIPMCGRLQRVFPAFMLVLSLPVRNLFTGLQD